MGINIFHFLATEIFMLRKCKYLKKPARIVKFEKLCRTVFWPCHF